MIEIRLEENQSGYDAVGEYIERYWKRDNPDGYRDDVVVRLSLSYNGKDFSSPQNEIIILNEDFNFEPTYDWWEGERFIRLYGIQAVEYISVEWIDCADLIN